MSVAFKIGVDITSAIESLMPFLESSGSHIFSSHVNGTVSLDISMSLACYTSSRLGHLVTVNLWKESLVIRTSWSVKGLNSFLEKDMQLMVDV